MSKTIDTITSLEELQTRRNETVATIGSLRDKFHERGNKESGEPGKFEGEERSQWDAANADLEKIDARIKSLRDRDSIDDAWKRAQEQEQRDFRDKNKGGDINDPRNGQRGEVTPEDRWLAFQGWCRYQMDGEASREQRKAMKKVKLSGHRKRLKLRGLQTNEFRQLQQVAQNTHRTRLTRALEATETRTLSTSAATGGEFIPEGFIRQVEINMLAFSGVLQVADILRTAGGGDLPWPTFDDTSNKGRLIAESGAVATNVDPSTSSVVLGAYKFTSDCILVPYELLEDEDLAPNLPVILSGALGERLGRIKEQYYTTGTNSSQPQGIVTGASSGKTAASTTAITGDEVIQLMHSVDPAYRNGAAFMMHDSVVLALRLLKDGESQYLWQPGLQQGVPDRLLGFPVFTNQEMASTLAADAKVMLFGQLSKHKVREVNNMRLYRLEERYRDNDQDGFVAFTRGDSKLLDAGTAPVKYLQMASS